MRISLFGWSQNFGEIINWVLNLVRFSFLYSLDRKYCTAILSCGCNAKQQRFFADWGSKHRLGGE